MTSYTRAVAGAIHFLPCRKHDLLNVFDIIDGGRGDIIVNNRLFLILPLFFSVNNKSITYM
jgi:hypothetical protein